MSDPRESEGAKSRYRHQLVAADIIARIQGGEWPPGTKIPSVDDLAQAYPFARMTVLKALQDVVAKGYLEARKGVGTFVTQRYVAGVVGFAFSDDVLRPQQTPMSNMLRKALTRFFERNGYRFKLYIERTGSGTLQWPENLREDIRAGRLDGLISAGSNVALLLPDWPEWPGTALPYVDMSFPDRGRHTVVFDREALVDLALQYFRLKGAGRVAMIGLADMDDSEGVRSKIAQAGFETRDAWLPQHPERINNYEEYGYTAMLALWRTPQKPNALMVLDDIMAKGVAQAILKLGVAVPDDLLTATHTNRNSGIFYPIPMCRIEYDIDECARIAGEFLLDLMASPELSPQKRLLRPVLRTDDGLALGTGGASCAVQHRPGSNPCEERDGSA